jgi:hypothetical protein
MQNQPKLETKMHQQLTLPRRAVLTLKQVKVEMALQYLQNLLPQTQNQLQKTKALALMALRQKQLQLMKWLVMKKPPFNKKP